MIDDAYIKIDLDAIKYNVQELVKHYDHYQYYIGVVKGMAYGHGFGVLKTMKEAGINYFAISTLKEALALRQYDKLTPCLCLEPIHLDNIELAQKLDITLTVDDLTYGQALLKTPFKGKVHLKLDTGMNRLGFMNKEDLAQFISLAKDILDIEGLYTHMASVGFYDDAYDKQVARFEYLTQDIDLTQFKIIHLERSLTLAAHKKLDYANGVRPGIILYGYDQMPKSSPSLKTSLRDFKHALRDHHYSATTKHYGFTPRPAFKLVSRILSIKPVHAHSKIGYGGAYTLKNDAYIAVVSIGYADGLMLTHNRNQVEINGKLYPIVGTINMKMISVLVDQSIKTEDEVILFGGLLSLQMVARQLDITSYKLLCDLSLALPRYYYYQTNLVMKEEVIYAI